MSAVVQYTPGLFRNYYLGPAHDPNEPYICMMANHGISWVLPPLTNSWIIIEIWLCIAINRTPNTDCYWVGVGFRAQGLARSGCILQSLFWCLCSTSDQGRKSYNSFLSANIYIIFVVNFDNPYFFGFRAPQEPCIVTLNLRPQAPHIPDKPVNGDATLAQLERREIARPLPGA